MKGNLRTVRNPSGMRSHSKTEMQQTCPPHGVRESYGRCWKRKNQVDSMFEGFSRSGGVTAGRSQMDSSDIWLVASRWTGGAGFALGPSQRASPGSHYITTSPFC